ncbi:hypothetical protein SEMRO_514_G158120.1 [Seminavis robusta]|uniref:Uncharacterized protein n=1 Tax=Seminavis robusta TaxID=568900 RepID=A0A9N8HIR0_9STRA|nr:hypothetical protein SEMRO_514_G158120.1 [Seminavis robusta]|eukprot:Sro514_g158120.1 n/a (201) ;mRNA; f:46591-47193
MPSKHDDEDDGKWESSEAKMLLREGIISGDISAGLGPTAVYEMNDEYKKFPFHRFQANFYTLRAKIQADYNRVVSDSVAYGHDIALVAELRTENPPRDLGYPNWGTHAAKKLLKADVDQDKQFDLKPSELWETRPEYKEFPLEVFRKHIYQEVDSRVSRAARFSKKKIRQKFNIQPRETVLNADTIAYMEAKQSEENQSN